jgi:hypothetical protein
LNWRIELNWINIVVDFRLYCSYLNVATCWNCALLRAICFMFHIWEKFVNSKMCLKKIVGKSILKTTTYWAQLIECLKTDFLMKNKRVDYCILLLWAIFNTLYLRALAQKSYSCMFGNVLTVMATSIVGVLCLMRMNGTDFCYSKLLLFSDFLLIFYWGVHKNSLV